MNTHHIPVNVPVHPITVKTPWYRYPIKRFKAWLKNHHPRLYDALRVAYTFYTKPKRQVSAQSQANKVISQKLQIEQAIAAPFTPVASVCAKHGPYYVSGFPGGPCPTCLREQYHLPVCGGVPLEVPQTGAFARQVHQAMSRQHLPEETTKRVGPRQRHLQHLIDEEALPDRVGVTAQEAEFLLDRHFARVEEDPDATTKREAIKKAG